MFAAGLVLFVVGAAMSVSVVEEDWKAVVCGTAILVGMLLMLASAALWLWRVMP